MSRRVEELLNGGRRADYERLKALKYALLLDDLRERGDEAAAQDLEAMLAPFADLALQDIVELGSPFFWLNAHRLYERDQSTLAALCEQLVTQAFDSYFPRLADGAEVALKGGGADVLLPRLGLRIPANGGIRLRRSGPGTVAVHAGGGWTTVDLEQPPAPWRLPRLGIAGEPSLLLLVSSPVLYDEKYLPLLAPETPLASALAATIADSLAVIRLADPAVAEQMRSLIGFYAPLSTPDERNHNSFSVPRLIGVIFLSETYHDLRLAEALVHEYHHNELSVLMEVEPLLEERPGELFYSPWRLDPRPLYGLIHAIHVFTGVVDFYRRAEHGAGLEPHRDEFRERRLEICSQLRLGLLQVPSDRLTPLGREVVDSIHQELGEHEAELGMPALALPPAQTEHLRSWRASHPDLAQRVRTA